MRLAAWVMGIAGAIAVFFGLVFLLAADDATVAFAGFTWLAGDVASAWAWLLLAGGVALLAGAAAIVMRLRRPPTG